MPSPAAAQPSAASKAEAGLLTAQGAPLPSAASSNLSNARATPEPKPADLRPADLGKLEADRTEAAKASVEQKQKALDEINQVMGAFAISVRFQIDPADQQVVIKVVDQESGKVIRQFPSEEVVRMSKALDNLKGLLFAQTA
jgi:flagellar protein FlaG